MLALLLPLIQLAVADASTTASPDVTAVGEIEDLSLEELLKTPITVASAGGAQTRTSESPGIVTLITRDEILRSGARDLIDVLRHVPGFDFANDVQATVGVAVRGMWANEGKVLVRLDGMPLNDFSYGSTLFGNRISVEQIERMVSRSPTAKDCGMPEILAVHFGSRRKHRANS